LIQRRLEPTSAPSANAFNFLIERDVRGIAIFFRDVRGLGRARLDCRRDRLRSAMMRTIRASIVIE
jgi:DUF2075 family protein